MSCFKTIWNKMSYENSASSSGFSDSLSETEKGELQGREFKCRICGTVMLVAAVVAAIFGILFVTHTFVGTSIAYLYAATCFAGAVIFIALAIIGLCGKHAVPYPESQSSSSSSSSSTSGGEESENSTDGTHSSFSEEDSSSSS